MRGHVRLFGIALVFVMATVAWLALSAITHHRMDTQSDALRTSVQSLWGNQQTQRAPELTFYHWTEESEERVETKDGAEVKVQQRVNRLHERVVPLASTAVDVTIHSDLRRKGLSWYSLYDVVFDGAYHYEHRGPEQGELEVVFSFPDKSALYDDFHFMVDGAEVAAQLDPDGGKLRTRVAVVTGRRVDVRIRYESRGLDQWQYRPADGVGRLEQFALSMHTDFTDIDFPAGTLSPTTREREGDGYRIKWNFARVVTGNGIGMITPSRIQPGELSTALSLSAPVSLFFYFFVIFVLSIIKRIDLHPLNYLLIAGAFFAFHLLFAYSVDHLPVTWAFSLASVVSVFLVVSYLRLAVSSRFAYVEAGIAQLVYLVGFSLAHFWEGFTGLTATVLAISTLFVVMQLTGRVNWSQALAGKAREGTG